MQGLNYSELETIKPLIPITTFYDFLLKQQKTQTRE